MNPEKKDYRRLETPTEELYSNFYGKKYDLSYEDVKYLEYRKWCIYDIQDNIDKSDCVYEVLCVYGRVCVYIWHHSKRHICTDDPPALKH